jgi:hypothetical protein
VIIRACRHAVCCACAAPGDGPGISVRDGKARAGLDEWVKIGVLRAPGMNATNLTLVPDIEAAQAMPKYLWNPEQPAARPGSGLSAGALAAAIVVPTIVGLLLAVALALFLVRRRRGRQDSAATKAYSPKDADWSGVGASDTGLGSRQAAMPLDPAIAAAGTSEGGLSSDWRRRGTSPWAESEVSGSSWSTQMAAGFVAWQAAVRTASAQLLDRRLTTPKSMPSGSPKGSGSKLPTVVALAGAVRAESTTSQQQQYQAAGSNGTAAAAAPAAAAQEGSQADDDCVEEEDGIGPYLPLMAHGRRRSMNLATLKLQMLLGRVSASISYHLESRCTNGSIDQCVLCVRVGHPQPVGARGRNHACDGDYSMNPLRAS